LEFLIARISAREVVDGRSAARFLVLLLGATRGLWVMATMLIACSTGLVGWVLSPLWSNAPQQIDSVPLLKWGGALGIGVVLFLLWQIPRISTRLANSGKAVAYAVFALGALGVVCLLPFASDPDAAWHTQVLLASLFGATLILSWLMLPTIFTLPGSAFIGRVSFSIYLIHAILADFAHYVHQTWGFPWLSHNPLVFAPIVIALAYVSYKLIEQPGIVLGKRITDAF